jgi:hypothetical protein
MYTKLILRIQEQSSTQNDWQPVKLSMESTKNLERSITGREAANDFLSLIWK